MPVTSIRDSYNTRWKIMKKRKERKEQRCDTRLYVLAMSRTRFGVNPHSIVAWMSRNSLLETGAKSEV